MAKIFDLDEVRKSLDAAEISFDDDGTSRKMIFFSTVTSAVPSGKYYTAWANSNVTDEEADVDAKWFARAEKELEKIGASLIHGDNDPCDLFIVRNCE